MASRSALFVLLLALVTGQYPTGAFCQDPLPEEPAVIVVRPGAPVQASGSRLSITCAAFGYPSPSISWSIQPFSVGDFVPLSSNNGSVDIYETVVFDSAGFSYVVSVLELMEADWRITQHSLACSADNGVNSTTQRLGEGSQVFRVEPEVLEPATLVAIPDLTFSYQGPRLYLTCAAYGSPVPEITWELGPLDSAGVSYNVTTTEAEAGYFDEARQVDVTTGDVVVVSTLQLCPTSVLNVSHLEFSCSTFNGDFNHSLGLNSATFPISPTAEVVRFSTRHRGNTLSVDVQFSGEIVLFNSIDCDIRRLTFLSSLLPNAIVFRPLYPGSCDQLDPLTITYSLDTRDYINLLQLGPIFQSVVSSFLAINETLLQPVFNLIPITEEHAILTDIFFPNVFQPVLMRFDVNLNSSKLFLHFDSVVELITLDPTQISLSTSEQSSPSQQIYTLTGAVVNNLAPSTTVEITLSLNDFTEIQRLGICRAAHYCFLNAPAGLVQNLYATIASEVTGLQVSSLRQIFPLSDVTLYMRVSVEFIGSSTQVNLVLNEPFIVREVDYVTRIECVSTTGAAAVLGWKVGENFVESFFPPERLIEPGQAFVEFSDRLRPLNFGIYTCDVSSESISHFFTNNNPFIGVLNTEYPVRVSLFDPVMVDVAFAQLPATIDPAANISLTISSGQSLAVVPSVEATSSHSLVVSWEKAVYSLSSAGEFVLQVNTGFGQASASFRISIAEPEATSILPSSIITIAPNDVQLSIECLTGSRRLPVQWTGGALVDLQFSLSPPDLNTMLEFEVPDLSIDGTTFTCQVVDPEDPSSVLVSTTAEVRYIPFEVSIFLNGIESLNQNDTIAVSTTDPPSNSTLTFYCLASSGNYDLSWTSQQAGQDEPVLITGQVGFSVEYDNNVATLSVGREYRGVLQCVSRESGQRAQVNVITDEPAVPGFQFTVEEYVGVAVAIFCTFVAMVILIFSCVCTKGRRYFVTAFLVHLSLLCAVNGSYWLYYAGVERAMGNRVGCAAVAALLQYFFTASFTWLLCESILAAFFEKCSKNRLSFIAFFVLGWGLPIIPTAISLGVLHHDYGTNSHCWFEVTAGNAESGVLWGFVVPKLILIVLTAGVVLCGACYSCCGVTSYIKNPAARRAQLCMIGCLLVSTVVLLLLLSGGWVFALLTVNQLLEAGSSATLGWVFMAFSSALGVFVVVFSLLVVGLNWRMMRVLHTGVDLPGGVEQDSAQLVIDNPVFMMSGQEKSSDQLGEQVEPAAQTQDGVEGAGAVDSKKNKDND